jgi:aminopeptidase N
MAHLDHLGKGWPDVREGHRGEIHPGADDNASGVAVLLEVARAMASEPTRPRPVVFAVVTGEEAGRLGSKRLLESMTSKSRPSACLNLDTIGRLGDDKLLVINADSAREWRFIFMGVQYTTGVQATIVSEPLDSSDQVSCLEHGVPAVQLFTGPHADYHRPGDTLDKLDLDGMAEISEVVREVAGYLAERTDPLTITIAGMESAPRPETRARGGSRRVSLGTMPDFSYVGPGVRVQQVLPGSAAEAAGVAPEDVLVAIDGEGVPDLKTYSEILKRHEPGDAIELTLERGGERVTVRAVLRAR